MFFGRKIFGLKNVFKKNFVSKKFLCPTNFVSKKNLGQITNLDKCCQDISCLDNGHPDCWHLLKIVPGTYLWNLVKIKTATSVIFLIWTNVTRTNVAWTNVTVTVGICPRCSQEPTYEEISWATTFFFCRVTKMGFSTLLEGSLMNFD